MKLLILALAFIPTLTQANSSYSGALTAALATGTVAAVATGTQYSIYHSLMKHELKGWVDKETNTTIQLDNQCNLNTEFHLVGDHRQNVILMGISNTSDKSVIVKVPDIEFIFNKANSRFPGWSAIQSDIEVKSHWWQVNYIPFPSKEEFAHYDNIEVRVPIYQAEQSKVCYLTAKFTKKEKILKEEVEYSAMDVFFEGGPSLAQNGPVKYLGKPSTFVGFGLNGFPHPNHGFGINFLIENGFENSKNTKVTSKFEKGADYKAQAFLFGINYVYRHFLTHHLTLQYEPSIGWQEINDMDAEEVNDRGLDSSFVFYHKIMLNWTFVRAPHPVHRMFDFQLGVGLVQIIAPNSEVGEQSLSGERYGALIRFGMGI